MRLSVLSGDLLLFGGESYDGKKVRVYGDLFKWDMDKQEWRRLEAPEMPKARCSHQAVYHKCAISLNSTITIQMSEEQCG